MSLAEDLASVRWRVTMLVATLVEMHCDVTQRRCSPNHGRFKELEQMHREIARDVEGCGNFDINLPLLAQLLAQ